MELKEIFKEIGSMTEMLIDEGAKPEDVIEALTAISLDCSLNLASTTEHAYLTVINALRNMTLMHISKNEEERAEENEVDDKGENNTDNSGATNVVEFPDQNNSTLH
ncbi:MAG: hypothetical protein P8N58_03025 [Emcibacteraceae bacterium]|nr:hypothetical protein [Emcibacteraceae bacterium]